MSMTRRDLLVASARVLPVLGGGGLVWAGLEKLGKPESPPALDTVLSAAGVQDLLKTAPRARFWTTATLAGADCLQCHTASDVLKKPPYAHDPKTVTVPAVRAPMHAQGWTARDLPGAGQRRRRAAQPRVRPAASPSTSIRSRRSPSTTSCRASRPSRSARPGARSAASSARTGSCRRPRPRTTTSRSRPPATVVAAASRTAPVIAFTYNEPTVFTEYLPRHRRAGSNAEASAP